MQVLISRFYISQSRLSITGSLDLDGRFLCYTLERGPAVPDHPPIPAGTYHCLKTKSPHLGYITPELMDVPGRSGIRIHVANHWYELEGCVAVGLEVTQGWTGPDGRTAGAVWQSRAAFDNLMKKLPDEFDLVIEDRTGGKPCLTSTQ